MCVLTTCPGLHSTVQGGQDSNLQPVDRKSSILTIRPLSHSDINAARRKWFAHRFWSLVIAMLQYNPECFDILVPAYVCVHLTNACLTAIVGWNAWHQARQRQAQAGLGSRGSTFNVEPTGTYKERARKTFYQYFQEINWPVLVCRHHVLLQLCIINATETAMLSVHESLVTFAGVVRLSFTVQSDTKIQNYRCWLSLSRAVFFTKFVHYLFFGRSS